MSTEQQTKNDEAINETVRSVGNMTAIMLARTAALERASIGIELVIQAAGMFKACGAEQEASILNEGLQRILQFTRAGTPLVQPKDA